MRRLLMCCRFRVLLNFGLESLVMKQWIAVEKLVAGIENAMSEREFLDQCERLSISDKDAKEWGLETLSVSGLLS